MAEMPLKATKGFTRIGDLLIPGGDGLPSFSESGLLKEAHRMLDFMPEADRKGLLDLAGILSVMPRFMLMWIFWLCARSHRVPSFLGAVLRQIDLGLKGLVYSVYYSDPAIRRALGWTAAIRSEVKP